MKPLKRVVRIVLGEGWPRFGSTVSEDGKRTNFVQVTKSGFALDLEGTDTLTCNKKIRLVAEVLD